MLRSVELGQVFGKKDAAGKRQDLTKASGETVVLSIDRVAFDKIKAETVQSDAEQKIEFLLRYVPKLRMSPRNIIEELDILFVKECYTKGYRIAKDGEINESVYFIRSGTCRLLQPVPGLVKAQMTSEEAAKYKYINLCALGVGQVFGEDSALNGWKSQETVEAESDKVEAYKISKVMLMQYFGGSASEVLYAIRAGVQAKKNWIQLKIQQIATAKKEDLLKSGLLRDEGEYKIQKPTKTIPGEIPYLKMVQTYGKPTVDPITPKSKLTKPEDDKTKFESAVATAAAAVAASDPSPAPPHAPKPESRSKARNAFMIGKAPDEEHKDDTLRGFGTMRLVASDRMKTITPQQMRGLAALRTIAQDVKSGGKQKQEPNADFNKDSVKKFQNTVMMADPAIAEKAKETAKAPSANFFRKMKEFNMNDLKAKLGQ